MPFKLFYSWQTKTPAKYNKSFIENCLKETLKQVKKEMADTSPEFYIDRDTKDVSGLPNIPTTIEEKVRFCDVFVGDVSYVAYIDTEKTQPKRSFLDKILGKNKWIQEGVYSTNVAEELGVAKGATRGSERIVTVMNTTYGNPDQLNFDSKQSRFPLTYTYNKHTSDQQRQEEKKKLIAGLKERVKLILETEHERQKEYFFPFVTWKSWERLFNRPFSFEKTNYIQQVFSTIKDDINKEKTIFRLCGLSGIGKTRMLFECFSDAGIGNPDELAGKLLYADVNEFEDKDIIKAIKELIHRKENKILIVDNCSRELHLALVPLITNENSKLSIITVSANPEEKANELDAGRATRLLILDNQLCKVTVDQILITNFKEFQPDELKLLVDFSSGIAFVATLMAQNPERGKYQPGSLTREDVVKRLLGPILSDEYSGAVVHACSLFSKFGYFDDLSSQADSIALDKDLFNVNPPGVAAEDLDDWKKLKFREICKSLHERQLLEKRGRTYSFRPSPLAVRMAEDWWRSCTVKKFERILPTLRDADLIESFCEQFRYLKHVENAKAIVKNLCADFFSFAEVLNTSVGSRLFRSFVYVNPIACADALVKAFLPLSKEELQKLMAGRRNLVWALEKLCFRPETFEKSTKVMAAFAIAENEHIGNNATNQFLQLFHIHLAGTAVNLEERWNIIDHCLNHQEEDYQSLGIKAISSALTVAHFSRMGGAEDQGDPVPLQDYNPPGKEVYEYWQKAILVLEKLALQKGPFQDRAITILNENFYGLSSQGGGKLIIPVMKKLLQQGLLDRMELRKKIQFILNSDRVFEQYALDELKLILDELNPSDFGEKFKILVQQPSHEEYAADEDAGEYGKALGQKIEAFAEEFLEQADKWEQITDGFMTSHIAEGFNFGKYISQKADAKDIDRLVSILLDKLHKAKPENRNISILLGILVNVPDKEYTRNIFHQLLEDIELKQIAFTLARSTALLPEDILLLLDETKKGNFTSSYFGEFNYGWGLRHLPLEKTKEILQGLRQLDNQGKAAAFFILSTWTHNDKESFANFHELMRTIIMEDSAMIFSQMGNTMDIHYYISVLSKLLTDHTDEELAKLSIALIIEQSNQLEHFYARENGFMKILDILQDKYFPVLWEGISQMYLNLDKYALAAFNLKSSLGSHHDYHHHSEGLLFAGSPEKFETIFEWCKQNKGREIYWIAELLPIFSEERSKGNEWHPFAKKFIDEFGNDKAVLSAIAAKIGTYSWTGSVVPKLESDEALFKQLLDHLLADVRDWAQLHLEDIQKRIKWEQNRDEDGII